MTRDGTGATGDRQVAPAVPDAVPGSDRRRAADGTRRGVVGAALVRDGRVLASRRTGPPALAGLWEFPGGKVEDGEDDAQALVRELREELGVRDVVVGERLGPDVSVGEALVLRVYLATAAGEPTLVDHDAHRWLAHEELDAVPWIAADAPLVEALRRHLRA